MARRADWRCKMNAPSERDNAPVQGGEVGTTNQTDSQFNPEYPTLDTQPSRLLIALLQGARVNPLGGWRSLGIYRLSDTVYQLRGMGWPVVTDRLDVANRFNEQCHVAQYYLPKETIADAGLKAIGYVSTGLQFAASKKAA